MGIKIEVDTGTRTNSSMHKQGQFSKPLFSGSSLNQQIRIKFKRTFVGNTMKLVLPVPPTEC